MKPLSTCQKAVTVCILAVILFFALFKLTESPPFVFDEGWAVQVGTNIALHNIDGLQFSPGDIEHVSYITSVGYPFIWALGIWMKIFGAGILQARLMMVFVTICFVAAVFILLRRLCGNWPAIASLALLATFPPFYTYGKSVMGEMFVLFYLTLCLLFFNLAQSGTPRRRFWLMVSGFAIGLCVVTKIMALSIAPVLVVVAFIAVRRKSISLKELVTVVLCALVPFVAWIFVHFRATDTLAGIYDYYVHPWGPSVAHSSILDNIKNLLTNGSSLYLLALMAGWIASAISRLKNKTVIAIEELIPLLFSALLLVLFLRMNGDFRYIFPIQALAIAFAPQAIYGLFGKERIFTAIAVVLCALGLYQVSFKSYVAEFYGSHYLADTTSYIASIPTSTAVFFYNTPHIVPLFKGSNYYQRNVTFDKWITGSDFASTIKAGKVDMLILGPHMLNSDQTLPLAGFAKVKDLGKISVFQKIGK